MILRSLRIWIVLGANVAVAAIALSGSAYLWARAVEPTTQPEVSPALPAIVGQLSVPFRVEPARQAAAARAAQRRAARARARARAAGAAARAAGSSPTACSPTRRWRGSA